MNNADLAAIDSDHNPRPLRDRTDEALRVELAINAREAVQLVDPMLRRCAEVMLGKVHEEMALRAEEREVAAAPVVQARKPAAPAVNYGPMTAAEHFSAAHRAVKAARLEGDGSDGYHAWMSVAGRHRIEAKHIVWKARPLERY